MLEQAITLARSGDKGAARDLLYQVVAQEPDNEHAWGWLATCPSPASSNPEPTCASTP